MTIQFPPEGLVYDYYLDDAGITLPFSEEDDYEEKLALRTVCFK